MESKYFTDEVPKSAITRTGICDNAIQTSPDGPSIAADGPAWAACGTCWVTDWTEISCLMSTAIGLGGWPADRGYGPAGRRRISGHCGGCGLGG